jgi:hypothetical protein
MKADELGGLELGQAPLDPKRPKPPADPLLVPAQ